MYNYINQNYLFYAVQCDLCFKLMTIQCILFHLISKKYNNESKLINLKNHILKQINCITIACVDLTWYNQTSLYNIYQTCKCTLQRKKDNNIMCIINLYSLCFVFSMVTVTSPFFQRITNSIHLILECIHNGHNRNFCLNTVLVKLHCCIA